jgi:hypothetical protein
MSTSVPLFTKEGPPYYTAAYAHNSPFATIGPYQEALSPTEETDFRAWLTAQSIPFDPDAPVVDYDMRGFWKDAGGTATTPVHGPGDHFPDTFKTPYDTTFSAESKYATGNNPFKWQGEKLVDERNGQIVFWAEYKGEPRKRLSSKTAREALEPDQLDSQAQLMKNDVDLAGLSLALHGKKDFPIEEYVLSGTINRTIEGASNVTIDIVDKDNVIAKSGRLGDGIDIEIDGLWFRLVKVSKTDINRVSLTFEARAVAVLRTYNTKKAAAWGKTTRLQFIKGLIDETKDELVIPLVAPGLVEKKPIKTKQDKLTPAVRVNTRLPGLPFDSSKRLTVKSER